MLREDTDPHWTDVIDGVPAQLAGGDIVWTGISGDTRGLIIAPAAGLATAAPLTPAGLQVQAVLGTDGDDVLFAGATEPTESASGATARAGSPRSRPSPACTPPPPAGGTTVLASRTWPAARSRCGSRETARARAHIASLAQSRTCPTREPKFLEAGPGRHPHRRALPVLARAGHQAAGADGPLRRARTASG